MVEGEKFSKGPTGGWTKEGCWPVPFGQVWPESWPGPVVRSANRAECIRNEKRFDGRCTTSRGGILFSQLDEKLYAIFELRE